MVEFGGAFSPNDHGRRIGRSAETELCSQDAEKLMRVTWILVTLQALASWFRSAARKSASTDNPTATGPVSDPAEESRHGVGTDFNRPQSEDFPPGHLHPNERSPQEQFDNEDVAEENGNIESSDFLSKPSSNSISPEEAFPGSDSTRGDQSWHDSTETCLEDINLDAPQTDTNRDRNLSKASRHVEEDNSEDINQGNASTNEPQKFRPKPREIPGRRGRKHANPNPEQRGKTLSSCPELICRRVSGSATWEIILSGEEECKLSAVQLNGEALDLEAQECRVPSFTGRLIVEYQGGQTHHVSLFEGDPLIFKLRRNWSGNGRRIVSITSGHFIVIAPVSWERAGRVPVEPEECTDYAFLAHYFHRQTNTTGQGLDGFREWRGSLVRSGIELTGSRVFDDSEAGDLFVGSAPNLRYSPEIVWARVGEEAQRGWAQNFLAGEQSLSDVMGDRQGRFFLRVYDAEARLLDSTTFRYSRDLRQIHVNGADYSQDTAIVPTSTGHVHTEVRLVDADGSMIAPTLRTEALQTTAPSGALLVPPDPLANRISCTLGTGSNGVGIVLDLPRIWWRMEDGCSEPGEWRDTPIVMTRQEFRKHSHSNASITLLSKRFGSVRAGFDNELAQAYRRSNKDDRITIPLAHFVDYAQIDRRLNEDVHLNVEWSEEIVSLIAVSADPMPEILSFVAHPATIFSGDEAVLEWATLNTGDTRVSIDPDAGPVDSIGAFSVRPTKTTRYTLAVAISGTSGIHSTVTVTVGHQLPAPRTRPAARVLSTGGAWRWGKGFSLRELQDVGMTLQEAATRSIPVDRRRRTSHRANVEILRSMLDG